MKEVSINRMNFLKHVGRGFTYRDMFYILGAWCVFLVIIYGIQILRLYNVTSRMAQLKEQSTQFSTEKDNQIKMLKSINKKFVATTAKDNVASIISSRPRWSKILRGLVRALPSEVWLDGIAVAGGGDEWYALKIKGKAKSQRALSTFIMRMEASGLFSHTALENTKLTDEKAGFFDYEMSTQPVTKELLSDG